jgi:hypothetical protein
MSIETESAASSTNIVSDVPFRVGIVTVGKELEATALKVFVLAMNRVQRNFEYEFLPTDLADPLLTALDHRRAALDREDIREITRDFPERFGEALLAEMEAYKIGDTRLPNYFVVISKSQFRGGYFNLRTGRTSVIALGDWERSMSPPSIIEFIQTLIVREALAGICPALAASQHFGSKACICDFSRELADVRLKVLNGFVCSRCREALDASGSPFVADEVQFVLSKEWIGDLSSSSSLAGTIQKFGVNLFVTKGLAPTWKERLMSALREDGVKELIKLAFAILLAGLLVHLGWKGG